MTKQKIAFIGGGNMTRCLIGGLIDNGIDAHCIAVGEPNKLRREQLRSKFGVSAMADNVSAIIESTVIILAVKPQVMKAAVSSISQISSNNKPLIISIAAGISVANLERWGLSNLSIVRAMPNTPALVRAGITTLFSNSSVLPNQHNQAESILNSVGKTAWVKKESLINMVTAISGSGPAYFLYLMEALEQAAIEGGLDRKIARLLTIETILGTARLAQYTDTPLADLRKQVTSPGGTTEAAIAILDGASVQKLFKKAINTARERAIDLDLESNKS